MNHSNHIVTPESRQLDKMMQYALQNAEACKKEMQLSMLQLSQSFAMRGGDRLPSPIHTPIICELI